MLRPKFLKDAAAKNNLFLAEDGAVLEIFDDEPKVTTKKSDKKAGQDEVPLKVSALALVCIEIRL